MRLRSCQVYRAADEADMFGKLCMRHTARCRLVRSCSCNPCLEMLLSQTHAQHVPAQALSAGTHSAAKSCSGAALPGLWPRGLNAAPHIVVFY